MIITGTPPAPYSGPAPLATGLLEPQLALVDGPDNAGFHFGGQFDKAKPQRSLRPLPSRDHLTPYPRQGKRPAKPRIDYHPGHHHPLRDGRGSRSPRRSPAAGRVPTAGAHPRSTPPTTAAPRRHRPFVYCLLFFLWAESPGTGAASRRPALFLADALSRFCAPSGCPSAQEASVTLSCRFPLRGVTGVFWHGNGLSRLAGLPAGVDSVPGWFTLHLPGNRPVRTRMRVVWGRGLNTPGYPIRNELLTARISL